LSVDTGHPLLHELKHLNSMSSPFAQKFMGKNPFTLNIDINPEANDKDYEELWAMRLEARRKRAKR
jgi:hypothetical protein